MAKKVVVTGHRLIDTQLAMLPLKIQKKLVRSALRKAGKLIQGKAKANLPKRARKRRGKARTGPTGETARGIRVRASKRSRVRIGIFVSTTERADERLPYGGAQLEFGRRDMRAQPFLRPAGYESEGQVRQMVVDDIKEQLRATMGFTYKEGFKGRFLR